MEFLEGFIRAVAGAFGIDAHVNALAQHRFHLVETLFTAVIVVAIDQHRALAVKESEQWHFGEAGFGDGLVSGRNERRGDRHVHQ